jgi:hypothetical protein
VSDFLHANTNDMSSDDLHKLTQIASTHLRDGEAVLEIRKTGIDQAQINVGKIINRRSGSGRTISVEKVVGIWTVTEVKGWFA